MLDLLCGVSVSGARECRVGFLRFFLLTASTLFCRATIYNKAERVSIMTGLRKNELRTISLSSPNLKLSWTTKSSYFLISYRSRRPFFTFLKSQAMTNGPVDVTMAFSSCPSP